MGKIHLQCNSLEQWEHDELYGENTISLIKDMQNVVEQYCEQRRKIYIIDLIVLFVNGDKLEVFHY